MTRDNNLVYCDNEHLPVVPWAHLLDNGFDQMLLSKKMALAKWFLPLNINGNKNLQCISISTLRSSELEHRFVSMLAMMPLKIHFSMQVDGPSWKTGKRKRRGR